MPMGVERSWFGGELQMRKDRACGRAIVSIGTHVAVETKRVSHRVTGNLVRSVHAAPVGYEGGADDERMAPTADLLMAFTTIPATPTPFGPAVEVGSWMPYACVEWVGRQHPGVTQGLEAVRGLKADRIVREAFKQEGL